MLGPWWHRAVSPPRSSNRTCGFPASGFPTGFTVRPTTSHPLHAVYAQWARTSSPRDTAHSDRSGRLSVCRPKANHSSIPVVTSAPEVRVLSSAGVTRLHRSYDPVRLPLTSPSKTASRSLPSCQTGLPRLPASPFRRAVPTTPADRDGCACRLLPHPCGLPRYAGGSASASSLSRPAQASLALRPVGLLNRPRRPSSRGFDPAGYPTKPLVSYQSNRQFPGWNLPPLVTRAFGAHCIIIKLQLKSGSDGYRDVRGRLSLSGMQIAADRYCLNDWQDKAGP